MDEKRFRFRAADCEAITDELSLVDWHGFFSRKGVDLCVDLFYDVIWSCFENFVPRTSNKTTKVAKKIKESEQRCMVDDINKCDQGRIGHITRWEKSHGAPKAIRGPPAS
jgi:hypothetical protein